MSPLLIERDADVAIFTLNRPDKANALDAELVEALHAALDDATRTEVRLVVLRGAGRNFCSGFDFTGFEEATVGELSWRFVRVEQLLQGLAHAPCATLALAQGGCFGAGADLLAGCRTRVAAPDVRLRMPGWLFGLALGTRRLVRLIGADAARRMLESAATLDASQGLASGLLTAVAASDSWPANIAVAARAAGVLTPDAVARLAALTVVDTRAADMATLVESLAAGDLKSRVRAFRAAANASSGTRHV